MDALLLVKASLVMALTLLAAPLLSRAPAIARHRFWTLVFGALLALPLLAASLPVLHVPLPAALATAIPVLVPDPAPATVPDPRAKRVPVLHPIDERSESRRTRSASEASTSYPIGERSEPNVPNLRAQRATLLFAAWLMGALVAAGALLLSLLRARRLARGAEDVTDPAWLRAAGALGERLGFPQRVRLLTSPRVGTPMAGGLWRPVIFLPASARTWEAEQRDVVLAHELAHLAGCDPLRHVVARLAVAVYWFHPLAWIAARHATVAREQACDEAVLALGTRPSVYARVLLDLADSMPPSAPALGALPMAERSLLETRLMAILDDRTRPTAARRWLTPAIGVMLLTLSLAAAQPFSPPSTPNVAPAGAADIQRPASDDRSAPSLSAPSPLMQLAGATSDRSAPSPLLQLAGATAAQEVRTMTVSSARLQRNVPSDSACWWDPADRSSFSGSISMSDSGGSRMIDEQVGTRGADRVIQKRFGDLRLCLVAVGAADLDRVDRPSQWPGRARRVVLEARRGSSVQRLAIEGAGGAQRTAWRVGSADRPFDAAAQRWRDRMLATLDAVWELSMLRGDVSSLRGQISSIRGQESSLRGEISSLRGEVSSLRGRQSSVRGEESSLRGRISSIRGHVSSLRGAISSERGAISSLTAARSRSDGSERARIAEHDQEIARLQKEISDYNAEARIAAVEREIAALDANGKVAAIEEEIRRFDLDGKVRAIEGRIVKLDVEGRVRGIEREIEKLDVERRSRQLEDRRDAELEQLDAAIAAIR